MEVAATSALIEKTHQMDCRPGTEEKYDKLLWDEIGPEIKANYILQRLGKRFPFLIDKLFMKVKKDESFRKRIENMLPYTGGRKEMGEDNFLEELKTMPE